MPNDKMNTGEQPTLEKLAAEGIPIRKCLSYEGLGEYSGGGNGNQGGGQKAAKAKPALAGMSRPKGGGGY